MKVKVDKNVCIQCGMCTQIEPNVFIMGSDGKAEVLKDKNFSWEDISDAFECRDICPVQAITISN